MAGRDANSPDTEQAATVWRMMSELVLDNQRRKAVADAIGMSFGRTRAIRRIAHRPMTMGELAEALGVERPNATALVNELETEGIVRRRPNPSDRRSTIVEATSKGSSIARRADAILDAPPDSLTSLTADELNSLERLLTAIHDRR